MFLCFQGVIFRNLRPYVWLIFKSGLYLRAGYDGMCTVLDLTNSSSNLLIILSTIAEYTKSLHFSL